MRTYPEPTERTAEVKVSTDDATLFEQRFVADTAAGAIRKYLEANEEIAQKLCDTKADSLWIEIVLPNVFGTYCEATGSLAQVGQEYSLDRARYKFLHSASLFWLYSVPRALRALKVESDSLNEIDRFTFDFEPEQLTALIENFTELDKIIAANPRTYRRINRRKLKNEWRSDREIERDNKRFARQAAKARKRGEVTNDPGLRPEDSPLDPHGDGTLRAGDPLFDAIMKNDAVAGTRTPTGWTLETISERNDAPKLDEVQTLDDQTAALINRGWLEVSKDDIYASAKEALADAADGTDALLDDATLAALQDAVRELSIKPEIKYGVESSVRWAYLSSLYESSLTDEQLERLTRGWNARNQQTD